MSVATAPAFKDGVYFEPEGICSAASGVAQPRLQSSDNSSSQAHSRAGLPAAPQQPFQERVTAESTAQTLLEWLFHYLAGRE